MKNLFAMAIVALFATSCTSTQFQQVLQEATNPAGSPTLTNADVIAGLKEALDKGAEHAVGTASVADGFWKSDRLRIPFPPDAVKVKNTLNDIGMGAQVEKFELTMNRAAENAAKEAVPVFLNAIKGMTVADGFAILKGGDHAATDFLKDKTTSELTAKFRPIVEKATQQVALTSYWTPLSNAYNTATLLTGGQAVNPDLDAYVTQKAIDGLFVLVADEEQQIRKDPLARTTDLLKRVFGAQ
ncbi:MAG: DUF4197 domain-containing protein [Bacteroidetes bacterium]|nr:DUF4197 domain-containing protein [Bacteroidota bacterium]MBS1941230.1 DUF4197 domain-containing protein [Bacteroidota bacterium]